MGYCPLEKRLQLIQCKELKSGKYDPVEHAESIRGMEKIFTVVEVPEDNR